MHAIGEDGPGRQLGHGVVVDHPGREHVTVESLYGTRRMSPISHVRLADANDPSRPARKPSTPAAQTPSRLASPSPAERWQHLFAEAQPQVLADPHWPTLAAQLERISETGRDVADLVDEVVADRALPADHPARSLDYRLANAAPPNTGPRPGADRDAPGVSSPAQPLPEPDRNRSGPAR